MEEFDLYVAGFFPNRSESPEDGLAKIFGIEPNQARALVRSLPRVIKKRVPADQVDRYMRALREIGADVELRRSPLAAQRVVAVGTSITLNEFAERPLTLPPPAAAPDPVPEPMPAPVPEPIPEPVPEPVHAVVPEPTPDPVREPGSLWADLDLPVRGARISIKPPKAGMPESHHDIGLGAHGRPGWMVESSQYDGSASAPEAMAVDESLPIAHSAPPAAAQGLAGSLDMPEPVAETKPAKPASVRPQPRASRASAARVSALSAPALRGRDASRASAHTGDYTRPVERRQASFVQVWAVRIAVRLGIAVVVFGLVTVARSMHIVGDDVDAQAADWAAPLDPTQTATAEYAAAQSGVTITAREWSSSTVNQWGNGDKDAMLRLIARLDAAGAKGVYPSDVTKTGALSIAAELRIELPSDPARRRSIDAVIRDFRAESTGVRPVAPEGDDDPFQGGTTTFLRLN